MIHEKLDLSKETSEARQCGIGAAAAWAVALTTFFIGKYAPLGKFAVVFLMFSGLGFLTGAWYTATAIFHGSTALVMRVSAAWRNPAQIVIALIVPVLLSLSFLRDGLPKWSSIEAMLIWSNCIPLLIIAFVRGCPETNV